MEKGVYNVKVVIALPNRIRSNEQPTQIMVWLRLHGNDNIFKAYKKANRLHRKL